MCLQKHLGLFESKYRNVQTVLCSPGLTRKLQYVADTTVIFRTSLSTDKLEGGRGYQCASLTRQQHGSVYCGLAGERGALLATLT